MGLSVEQMAREGRKDLQLFLSGAWTNDASASVAIEALNTGLVIGQYLKLQTEALRDVRLDIEDNSKFMEFLRGLYRRAEADTNKRVTLSDAEWTTFSSGLSERGITVPARGAFNADIMSNYVDSVSSINETLSSSSSTEQSRISNTNSRYAQLIEMGSNGIRKSGDMQMTVVGNFHS